MRKIVSLLSVLMLFCALAYGQTRTVTAQVRDEKGEPIPNATITETGTRNAAKADLDGNFTIKIKEGSQLTITAIGYTSRTVTPGTAANQVFALTSSTATVQETVVVTALGIRRKPQEIGYATATVKADQITAGKEFNLAQSLSGKVSGLTISNTSAAVNATPRITLRGMRSMLGDNTALIVLDGVPVPSNTINYINPNDVERIDVLKGGQAATLFGTEGTNGAILITTKKGTQRPELTFGETWNAEKLAYIPKMNTTFGSGSAYGSSRGENFMPAENQEYGDAYDGSIRPLGRVSSDGSIQLLPYANIPNGRKDIWPTGNTNQADLSYRVGDANSNFFASYQNVVSNGIVKGDKYYRNSFRMNAGRTYGKFNLSFDATYTWDHANTTNADFYFYALNTNSWVPLKSYQNWHTGFGNMSNYFNDYYENPWWLLDNQRNDTRNNYFNGNVTLTFKPLSSLEFRGRAAIANTDATSTNTSNSYTYTGWAKTGAFVNYFNNDYDRLLTGVGRFVARSTPLPGGLNENQSNGSRLVFDLTGTYTHSFNDVSLKAILGGAASIRRAKSFSAGQSGLGVPDLYNFSNPLTGLYTASDSKSEQRKIGFFGDVTLGYKDFIYLEGIARQDYTSVFYSPSAGFSKPNFSTYGADLSILVSNIVPSIKGSVVDALKIRASYNVNGNDNLGAYSLQTIYTNNSGFPYSGLNGVTVGNTKVDPNIQPEIVKSAEVGFELGLLKNRISVEANYYHQNSDKQILSAQISPSTGFTNYLLNAAAVNNNGYEADVKANVFRTKDWNINVNANYSHNENKVTAIYGGLTSIQYQSSSIVSLNAELGHMFPYLKTSAWQRDPSGRIVVDQNDGWPLLATDFAGQGTTLPTDIFGAGLNVSFKGLTLTANAEYRAGNVIFSNIGNTMVFTGASALTTMYNRDQFVWPNSVYADPANPGKYIANTNIAVDQYKAIYQGFGDLGLTRGFTGVGEILVSSGAFWKLRDLNLTYELPRNVMNHIKAVKGISVSVWGRNLVTLRPKDNWFTDPEFSNTNGNSTGINVTGNTPPTYQLGGTLRITL